jgi:hypothetical protein
LTFYIIPVEKFLAQTIYYFRQINKAIYFLFFRLFSNIHIQTAFPANHNRDHDQANASSKTFDGGRSNAVNHLSFRVDILEKRYLVKRTRIGNDRCKIHLEVTNAGIEFIKEPCSPAERGFRYAPSTAGNALAVQFNVLKTNKKLRLATLYVILPQTHNIGGMHHDDRCKSIR